MPDYSLSYFYVLVFFGTAKHQPHGKPGNTISVPLVVLAALSVAGGFVELSPATSLTRFVQTTLPAPVVVEASAGTTLPVGLVAPILSLTGVALAYILFVARPALAESVARSLLGARLHRWWFGGWGFDWLYESAVVSPFIKIASAIRGDPVDLVNRGVGELAEMLHRLLSLSQSGKLRWYAAAIAVGAIAVVAIGVLT